MTSSGGSSSIAIDVCETGLLAAVSTQTGKDENAMPVGSFSHFSEKVSYDRQLLRDEVIRGLMGELYAVQERSRIASQSTVDGSLEMHDTLSFSREYRSALRSAYEQSGGSEADRHADDYTVWSLFEGLFFKAADNPIALDLSEWAGGFFNVSECTEEVIQEQQRRSCPIEETTGYWRAVALLLSSCQFGPLCHLLSDCGGGRDPSVNAFVSRLQALDMEWLGGDEAARVTSWQSDVRADLDAAAYDHNKNIKFIAKALAGDRQVMEHLATMVVTEWWQLMPLFTLTFHPAAAFSDLAAIAEECRSLYPSTDGDAPSIYEALFAFDALSVIQQMLTRSQWCAVHMADLLYRTDKKLLETSLNVCEQLKLDYGNLLVTDEDLWQVGAEYLLECGETGRSALEEHLINKPIDCERDAIKVYTLCVKEDLRPAKETVINTMTFRYLRSGEWSAALSWALRGGKARALETTIHTILFNASATEISRLLLLDQMGDLVMFGPSFSFLYSYYRFHRSYADANMPESCEILFPLLTSADVPANFHDILFDHLVNVLYFLIEEPKIPVNPQHIYDLMAFFQRHSALAKFDNKTDETRVMQIKQLLGKCTRRFLCQWDDN